MCPEAYRCILADPPWPERGGGKIKRGADRHYPLLDIPDIIRVMLQCPKWQPAPDCHLWIWSSRQIGHCLAVIDALGFKQKSFVVWSKLGGPGLGQYVRYKSELLLLATRGRAMVPKTKPENVILQPRVRDDTGKIIHSRKPAAFHELIEVISPGPRLEMFARESTRHGWEFWGDECST